MKDVILKTAETKFRSVLLTDTNMTEGAGLPARYQLGHNTISWYNIFNNSFPDAVKHPLPVQGDKDTERNGDEIYATGVRVAGSIQVTAANKSAVFRMFLVEFNDQVYSSGANLGTYNETFHNVTGSTQLDTFQHDRIRPKYLGTYRSNYQDLNDSSDGTINFKLWLPLKRKFTFREDTSAGLAMGIKNKYALMLLPYDKVTTPQGTTIGQIATSATFYYKDP